MASLMNGQDRKGQLRAADHDIELALARSEGLVDFEPRDVTADSNAGFGVSSETQRLVGGLHSSRTSKSHEQSTSHGLVARWRVVAGGACAVLLLLVLLAAIAAMGGGARPPENVTYARFQIVGDWGRNGLHNQSDVATVMGAVAHDARPDFIISTGDNFYESGLTSVADEQFRTSFADVYTAPSLKGVPWHAVLGNHDYGEIYEGWDINPNCTQTSANCSYGPLNELNVGLRQRDARWHCERSFRLQFGGGKVDFFFYDTSPFIQTYHNATWSGHIGGIDQQSWQANLAELESRLAMSHAEWKLVVGHHPVVTSGTETSHRNQTELFTHVRPVLEKYGVQVYFNGHDHHLEHLKTAPRQFPHYIISGAGSRVRPVRDDVASSIFRYYGSGFVEALLKAEVLTLKFFGILDEKHHPIYSIAIPRTATSQSGRRKLMKV